jgi:hypothetical protein
MGLLTYKPLGRQRRLFKMVMGASKHGVRLRQSKFYRGTTRPNGGWI